MKRRHFLQQSALLAGAGLLSVDALFGQSRPMKKIGIQLFSLPKMLSEDFRGTLAMLSDMGYEEVELFGPYPFSDPASIEQWQGMSSMLGFSGSGYFGQTASQIQSILAEYGLSSPSVHSDLVTLETRMDQFGEAAAVLGFEYVVLPAIPDQERKNLDAYRQMADRFNAIGEKAKAAGIKFAYHNHGYGLQEVAGQIPFEVLIDGTDPELVFLEMDVFWTKASGADPIAYLKKYPKRYHLLHLKDMKEDKRFSGDGSDATQWFELFPYMTTAGEGVMDLDGIIEAAKKTSVKHYFVEQDLVADPKTALRGSYDYLASL